MIKIIIISQLKSNLISKYKKWYGNWFYIRRLCSKVFSIFSNNKYFCFLESKISEYIISEKKLIFLLKSEQKPFIFINNTNINEKNLFNILLLNYIEKYHCEYRPNKKEDVLWAKVKYNIVEYPKFMFLLFVFQYNELNIYKKGWWYCWR